MEKSHQDKWLEAEAKRKAYVDSNPWQWSVDNFESQTNAATLIQVGHVNYIILRGLSIEQILDHEGKIKP
jgi:hypothetical protein